MNKKQRPRKPAALTGPARLAAMIEMRAAKKTYQEIADAFGGLSRERVRQILAKAGKDGRLELGQCVHPDGCPRDANGRDGWCPLHRHRLANTGEPGPAMPTSRVVAIGTPCVDCGRKRKKGQDFTRGRCRGCYSRWAYANLPGRKETVKDKNDNWRRRNCKPGMPYYENYYKPYHAAYRRRAKAKQ